MTAPITDLPNAMIVDSRDTSVGKYCRDYSLRKPGADVSENSQPFIDACAVVDATQPIIANAITIANYVSGKNKGGPALDEEARRLGTIRLPPAGATGFVTIVASAGGTTIEAGDEIKNIATGLRYQCIATALYLTGQQVPVTGKDTGPSTDVAAGISMQWTAPRPGCGQVSTVFANSDGSGLTGGRDTETDQQLDDRLILIRSTPAASGNVAQFQQAILGTPGQSIGSAFVYPAVFGPGSICCAFLLNSTGAGRIPNAAQIALVKSWLVGQFPADDSITMAVIVANPINLSMKITWLDGVPGWTDASPFPQMGASAPTIGTVTSATSFQVIAPNGDTPQVGQTLAVYNVGLQLFMEKRILTATLVSGTTWAITCDTTNNASDVSYTPVPGQLVCPWSDSLQTIVSTVSGYFDGLGPGEQFASLPDPGLRQRRYPSTTFSNALSRRILSPVDSLDTINDADVYFPALPYSPPTGTPGVAVYLTIMNSLGAYP